MLSIIILAREAPSKSTVLAYAFGTHGDEVLLQLKELLSPFGISLFYTDDWGAYKRYLEKEKHEIGKRSTQIDTNLV